MTGITREHSPSDEEPPPYNPAVVSKVASKVEISDVVLTDLHFVRQDGGPLADPLPEDLSPSEVGIAVNGWKLRDEALGCSLSFRTFFDDGEDDPYVVMATYRLVYDVKADNRAFDDSDVAAFVYWNAVFNAWPYWRELLTSVMNRAQLPRYLVPVLGLPQATDSSPE